MIEGYQIESELQRGPVSTVYRARQTLLDRTVILKVLNRQLNNDAEIRERFAREAQSLAHIRHSNIVTVYDYGISEDHTFIAMEYIEGTTLAKQIRDHGPLDNSQTQTLFDQIGSALQTIHEMGIVHRDVKPENILVDAQGHFRLTDFGLAHLVDGNHMTQQGASLGTPAYMAPELIEGAPATASADIFSFGVTLYEALTGISPFKNEQLAATLQNVLSHEIDFDTPPVPEPWRALLQRMLQKKVNLRATWNTISVKAEPKKTKSGSRRQKPKYKQLFWTVPFLILAIFAAISLFNNWKENDNQGPHKQSNQTELPTPPDSMGSSNIAANAEGIKKTTLNSAKSTDSVQNSSAAKRQIVNVSEKDSIPVAPAEPLEARLHIMAVPWADVYIDSSFTQTTPFTLALQEGNHILEFRHPSRLAITETVTVHAGKTDTISVFLPVVNGYLNVWAVPWGNVFINDKAVGETPIQNIALPQGKHFLRVENPSYPSVSDTIIIEAGKTTERRISFIASGI